VARDGDGVEVDVDASEFRAFARQAPREAEKVATTYYRKGSQVVRDLQVGEATDRFGVETEESRMRTVDPSRPTGRYAASIQTSIKDDHADTGPRVPYKHWVEQGSNAPPRTIEDHQQNARFIGHRPVTRATRQSRDPLERLLTNELEQGIRRSTRGLG
jgi:hypothetical protein